jgi:hypothetical protein
MTTLPSHFSIGYSFKTWEKKSLKNKIIRVYILTGQYFSYPVYRDGRFYWWRKPNYPEKNHWTCRKSMTNFIT